MMNSIDNIKNIMSKNNGILLTQDITKNNIHRQYIKILEKEGVIEKVARGIYVEKGKNVSEYYILMQKYKKCVFSHNTALYFYDLTDRTPINLDLTFPSNFTIHDDTIKIHYIKEELFELGKIDYKLEDGTIIKIYDLERTICDILRDRNKIDPQIFNDTLKNYIKRKDKNLVRLYEYAKKFNIDMILRTYMEVL